MLAYPALKRDVIASTLHALFRAVTAGETADHDIPLARAFAGQVGLGRGANWGRRYFRVRAAGCGGRKVLDTGWMVRKVTTRDPRLRLRPTCCSR